MHTFEQKIKFLRMIGFEIGKVYKNEQAMDIVDSVIRLNDLEMFVSEIETRAYWDKVCLLFIEKCIILMYLDTDTDGTVMVVQLLDQFRKRVIKPKEQSIQEFIYEFIGTL